MNNREAIEVLKKNYPQIQIIYCKDCVYGEQLPDRVRCELMDYLPFDFEDFCSEGVKRVTRN